MKGAAMKLLINKRSQKRNELSERVCREVRYQMEQYGRIADIDILFNHVEKWMRVAKKNKYTRP